jgi:hypothetical protein
MRAMNCPAEIAEIILDILAHGVLRARAAGWSGDSRRSALETDHIHNLPDLLRNFSSERLQYYWEVERPSFVSAVGSGKQAEFEPLWQRLEEQVEALALKP